MVREYKEKGGWINRLDIEEWKTPFAGRRGTLKDGEHKYTHDDYRKGSNVGSKAVDRGGSKWNVLESLYNYARVYSLQ